jgi:hypothetical protein
VHGRAFFIGVYKISRDKMARDLFGFEDLKGPFPSPFDDREEYEKRTEKLLDYELPFERKVWEARFKQGFGWSVSWVKILFTSKLPFWRLAAVSIRDNKINKTLFLSESLKKRKFLDEAFKHEAIHLCRQNILADDNFEEQIAYFFLENNFQKVCSSFFCSPLALAALVFTCSSFFILDLFFLYNIGFLNLLVMKFTLLLFLFMCAFRSFSLVRRVFRKLKLSLRFPGGAQELLVRLTKEEVLLFSRLKKEEIKAVAFSWANKHFRWGELYKKYF